jgi:hypothetical protein
MDGTPCVELDRRRVAFVYHSSAGPYTSDKLIARSVQTLANSVDEEFASLGLHSVFPDESPDVLDACMLLENTWSVLMKLRDFRTLREDTEERLSRVNSDLSHSRVMCARLQADLDRVQRNNAATAEKCR